jgi:hypothetical protein
MLARHRAAMRTAAQHRGSHGWRPNGKSIMNLIMTFMHQKDYIQTKDANPFIKRNIYI